MAILDYQKFFQIQIKMAENRQPHFRPSGSRDRSGEGGGGRLSSHGSGQGDGPNFYRGDSSERLKLNQQFYKNATSGISAPYPGYPPVGQGMLPYGMMMPPPGYPPYPYPHPQMMGMPIPMQMAVPISGNMAPGGVHQGMFYPSYPYPPMLTPEQQQQMAKAAATHAAAGSTQGFSHIKLQNLIKSQGNDLGLSQDPTTTKKTAVGDETQDVLIKTGGITLNKTEAGDGMFGADIELESLTDSDDGDHEDKDEVVAKISKQKKTFKIVTGEDSDSIFEEHLQQNAKFEDMDDYDDYDEEAWNLDDYNDMNEQVPEQLPLETILEENSIVKDSPPQPVSSKSVNPGRPVSAKTGKPVTGKRVSPSKRVLSPSKAKQQQPTLKGKTMHQSPSGRRYPEMSEHERKLAEADAYLRKIQVRSAKQKILVLQKREKVAQNDKEMELSQISNWTGESQFNVETKEREQVKRKQQSVLDDIHRTGLPDREQLVDTIIALRQEKNLNEEEIRLLKVAYARIKKQLVQALEQATGAEGGTRSDWIKNQPETASGMLPTDLEHSMNEIRKLKKTVNSLQEQNSFFKVAAEKYQKRAIYVRKKYAQLLGKTKNGGDLASSVANSTASEDKLRLKCSQLKTQISKHNSIVEEKNQEINKLKTKVAGMNHLTKFRLEAEKYAKICDKLTQRLLLLERNEQKKKQYEELRSQLQQTMLIDDIETADREEAQRQREIEDQRLDEEQAKAKEEAAALEAEEIKFDDDRNKYQENLFFKLNQPIPSNKDIYDAVGLEYVEPDLSKKKKTQKKNHSGSVEASMKGSQEFVADIIDEGDQALPDYELTGEKSMPERAESESSAAVTVQNPTKDYVAATLNAWNACPTIVKKQLDKQNEEIADLKAKLREADLKIQMKKNDFEKLQAATMKKEIMKHKENIEIIYKRKLEDEKRKLLKQRVEEVDQLMKENKRLNAKIGAKW